MDKQEYTLEFDSLFEIEIFEAACKYSPFNDIEILRIEDFIKEREVYFKNWKRVRIKASLNDIFWIGRFYERIEDIRTIKLMRFKKKVKIEVPIQLLKLCELFDVSPHLVLQSFANDLSQTVHGSSGSDERSMAVEYFLRGGYSSNYDHEDAEEIFEELMDLRRAWPGNHKEKEYDKFFKKELKEWFERWKAKSNQQIAQP